jgi:hypothetical protein
VKERKLMRHPAIFSLMLALFATTAGAAPASKLMCAIVDVFDCSGKECTEVTSEAVGVPDLVRFDPTEKSMTALDAEFGGRTTALESMTKDDHKTTARAHEGDRSLVLVVEDESGDAVLTVSDNKVVLVGYGECNRF